MCKREPYSTKLLATQNRVPLGDLDRLPSPSVSDSREGTNTARNGVDELDSCAKRQGRTAVLVAARKRLSTQEAHGISAASSPTTSCMPHVKSSRDRVPADLRIMCGCLPLTRYDDAIHARISLFFATPLAGTNSMRTSGIYTLTVKELRHILPIPMSLDSGTKMCHGNPVHSGSRRDIPAMRKYIWGNDSCAWSRD